MSQTAAHGHDVAPLGGEQRTPERISSPHIPHLVGRDDGARRLERNHEREENGCRSEDQHSPSEQEDADHQLPAATPPYDGG